MGKPKCTAEAIESAVRLKGAGASSKDIAACLLIHESTFYKWISEPKTDMQREFGESLKKAEAEYKAHLQAVILEAAERERNPSWQAAAWLLERKYPQEFAKQTREEAQHEIDVKVQNEGRHELEGMTSEEIRESMLKDYLELADTMWSMLQASDHPVERLHPQIGLLQAGGRPQGGTR